MGKIGLFGGTFDPPHKGHIKLASAVLDEFSLDKHLFIPAGNPPHKKDKKKTKQNTSVSCFIYGRTEWFRCHLIQMKTSHHLILFHYYANSNNIALY